MAGGGRVDRVLQEDRRIVVGERAVSASAPGDAAAARVSTSRDLEMSQFWQNLHARLHPRCRTTTPASRAGSGSAASSPPGPPRTRSTGHTTCARPDQRRVPARKHNPRWPSCNRQARGHTSHWTRPSSRRCQYVVGTVHGSSKLGASATKVNGHQTFLGGVGEQAPGRSGPPAVRCWPWVARRPDRGPARSGSPRRPGTEAGS